MKHRKGDVIKVGLPGESLWAEVVAVKPDGIHAELRNESVHEGISWGDEVVLGPDDYTIVRPKAIVRAAQDAVDSMNQEDETA